MLSTDRSLPESFKEMLEGNNMGLFILLPLLPADMSFTHSFTERHVIVPIFSVGVKRASVQ